MPRFLHLADIHLGFDRYDNKERTQDFYYALNDAIETYAIAQSVDFVVIAGDLFEHRTIQPNILNQAQLCLQALRDAEIPVLAIEGNHDNRPYGTKTSWLRYLSDWGLLKLLEPGDVNAGEPFYAPWDETSRRGGYLDLPCGVRVLGSHWYGATAPKAIEQIAAAIGRLPRGPAHTLLMFHHGLEGQIARYQGALRYADLLPLKDAGVDYLALGHIHKNYAMEGWIFNPGSVEANSVEEGGFERGVYLVELSTDGIEAKLQHDYYQRPIVRLRHKVTESQSMDDVEQGAIARIEAAVQNGVIPAENAPIVELRIEGSIGFDRLDLDIRQLKDQLQKLSGALIFLLKFEAEMMEYASPIADGAERLEVEREVFRDLLAAHNTYKNRTDELSQGLIHLKEQHLDGRSEDDLYEFLQQLLLPNANSADPSLGQSAEE
ncbi:MAG: metallophosphoesterase [Kaiparowitsia implicata GSE-PSE-MK54-09C]|jgi:DNA repair exonuclease SbcCD nuclease subunit|nr:metallophosphoesterase [Kaiparowitsia implicata GSE-PSE-MK54-09C]